jgi:hypothetical protein
VSPKTIEFPAFDSEVTDIVSSILPLAAKFSFKATMPLREALDHEKSGSLDRGRTAVRLPARLLPHASIDASPIPFWLLRLIGRFPLDDSPVSEGAA